LPLKVMLIALIGLSFVKAALIIAYFMHLKFERLNLVLTIIPAMVLCLLLMNVFFLDSKRLTTHGVNRQMNTAPVAGGADHP
jgi:cytochrome c oxidase subunit IV